MKWADKKAAIIVAIEEYGYTENRVGGTWKIGVENSPMIATVFLKTQPKQGENIPVVMINPDDLDADPSDRDIGGVLESTKQIIRTAINDLEAEQKDIIRHPPGEQIRQTNGVDEPTKPLAKQDIKPTKEATNIPATLPPASVQLTGPVTLTIDIVQQYINPDATPEQAFNFIQLCEAHKLNPFIGEAHLIIYKGKAKMVIGVGGLMRRAQEEADYNGYEAGIIILKENNTIEEREGTFMLKDESLVGGWCKVYRKGIERPFVTKVSIDEYIQKKADGVPNKVWGPHGMPATMICKVSKSQCHRDAYMGRNSGLYEQVEMTDLGDVEVIE